MKLTYRLVAKKHGGYLAECVESEVTGEGATHEEAKRSLEAGIAERMFRPDAVAPPSRPERAVIELVRVDDEAAARDAELDLGGPGDAPLSR